MYFPSDYQTIGQPVRVTPYARHGRGAVYDVTIMNQVTGRIQTFETYATCPANACAFAINLAVREQF